MRPVTTALSQATALLAELSGSALSGLREFLQVLLLQLLLGVLLLAMLAMAYTAKRALGLDLVPGVDMLPDEAIEPMIASALSLFGL